MRFRTVFLTFVGILVVHVLFITFGVYTVTPEIDNVLHFSGGFACGMLAVALHTHMSDKHEVFGHPRWFQFLFVLGVVMTIGVLWELHEFVLDHTLVIWYHWAPNQLDLFDTMLDLIMDGLGGSLAYFVFREKL